MPGIANFVGLGQASDFRFADQDQLMLNGIGADAGVGEEEWR
jgi:hypothetical protein